MSSLWWQASYEMRLLRHGLGALVVVDGGDDEYEHITAVLTLFPED